jgi:putative N6-adenine-specific DNA methylase
MAELFAVSAPGLEPFTAQELDQLGLSSEAVDVPASLQPTAESGGGIAFTGSLEAVYRANLFLRTASRVLVRLGEFHAAAFSELHRRACRLDWVRYIKPGKAVAVRVTCHKSRLYHSAAVAREVAKAIGSSLGQPVDLQKVDDNDEGALPQLIIVRLVDDQCTISVDSSGALLHRRGYRLATAKAPLRETLAAGLILASGWDGKSPLLDPFCGSGTIPIEAALMASRIAPGGSRRFAFMDWPGYDPASWQSLLTESANQQRSHIPKIYASDRDAGAVQMAQANAQRAGVVDQIEFSCRAVSAIEPEGVGWVVTNPPYGLRVSANKDLRNLYAQFGKVLRNKCVGWQVAILCSDLQLLHQTGLQLDTHLSLVNGGVNVKVGKSMVGG